MFPSTSSEQPTGPAGLGGLEARLGQGFWSLSAGQSGRPGKAPPRPVSRSSSRSLLLAPLDSVPSLAWSSGLDRDDFCPSPARRHAGHLGAVQGLRRSAPPFGSSNLWELGLSTTDVSDQIPRRSHEDLRIRCSRRPADFGASLLGRPDSGLRRGRSCAGLAGSKAAASSELSSEPLENSAGSQEAPSAAIRCSSVPAVGSDGRLGSRAGAVAALQKLFFEEMSRCGGQDANGAAARALLRLTEISAGESSAPLAQHASAGQVASDVLPASASPQKAAGTSLSQQLAALGDRPSAPHCPSPMAGRRRRPCPHAPRKAVHA